MGGQYPAAPEFPAEASWLNTPDPLSLSQLRGRAVLLDFCGTLGCINCQHIVVDLKQLESEFKDTLIVIGVHSGKYDTEREDESIREAISRLGVQHPVVNDPRFDIWESYDVSAWPTLVLIDPAGNIVGTHAGEGVYNLFQPILTALIEAFDSEGLVEWGIAPVALDPVGPTTVLSYPSKAIADSRGRIYVADAGHDRVVVVGTDGDVERVIGSGEPGFIDGSPELAQFQQPQGLALSPSEETLYVADTRNHTIRAIDLEAFEVTTIAGTGDQLNRLPSADSKGTETSMASPWDVFQHGTTLVISMAGVHQLWALDLGDGSI